jgi:predicted amidohydrolase
VAPWGEVLVDAGEAPGVYLFEIDMDRLADARRRVPSLANRRNFEAP